MEISLYQRSNDAKNHKTLIYTGEIIFEKSNYETSIA